MPWNPAQYQRFQQERAAPFFDLAASVQQRDHLKVVDLGCGTGELTAKLAAMLSDSDVTGIDSSAEMLAQATQYAQPGLRFEQRAIQDSDGAWDLIFSNAALQWVDDHATLIPRLFAQVRPGGQLAVQVPSNFRNPSHRLITEIAAEEPFRVALNGWSRHSPVLAIDAYAELLYQGGGTDIVAFEKVYPHILADADAVAEWTKGTTLLPYFERLPVRLHAAFEERYRERLRMHWPINPVFYGFRRTLFVATRG